MFTCHFTLNVYSYGAVYLYLCPYPYDENVICCPCSLCCPSLCCPCSLCCLSLDDHAVVYVHCYDGAHGLYDDWGRSDSAQIHLLVTQKMMVPPLASCSEGLQLVWEELAGLGEELEEVGVGQWVVLSLSS